MIKNIVIGILVLAVIGEGAFLYKEWKSAKTASMMAMQKTNLPAAGPNAKGATNRPIILSKGMNLTTTPLFKYAYQIFPGEASGSAKQALTGWTIATQPQKDGSTIVSLTPKDSDDQSQQYTLQAGQILYFIEQTPADDKADMDKDLNYRDDYGIITDSKGMIQ